MQVVERAIGLALVGIRAALTVSAIPADRHTIVAYYLAQVGTNCDGGVLSRVVGCSRANINKALHKVEDLRDDPAFDAALTQLETQLFGAL